MNIGDIVVFIGVDYSDEHLENFTYGNQYRISSFSDLPDGDTYGPCSVILFENCNFGVLKHNLEKYFIPIRDFRDSKLSKILK